MHLTYVCLSIYLKYQGFARFCTAKYSSAQGDLDNVLMHLTNVAVQKHAEDYNEENGGKWHIKNLRLWLQATCGQEATAREFSKVSALVYLIYKAGHVARSYGTRILKSQCPPIFNT